MSSTFPMSNTSDLNLLQLREKLEEQETIELAVNILKRHGALFFTTDKANNSSIFSVKINDAVKARIRNDGYSIKEQMVYEAGISRTRSDIDDFYRGIFLYVSIPQII